jgi:hypothetical protein
MTTREEYEKSEEEIMELVATGLSEEGFQASADNTGGGIVCVVLQRENGGEIVWGTADVTWGASVVNADGVEGNACRPKTCARNEK